MPACHVVVSGPLAAGKTTLAQGLAQRLGTALVSKDRLKEALWESLRPETEGESLRMSGAAMSVLYDVATRSRVGLVLEANWRPEVDVPRLRKLELPTVQVFCHAPSDLLRERLLARIESGERHPVHRDVMSQDVLDAMLATIEEGDPAPLPIDGPVLRVETTKEFDVTTIATWVEHQSGLLNVAR